MVENFEELMDENSFSFNHGVDIENDGGSYLERKESSYLERRESNTSMYSDREGIVREPLLKSRINTTSQIAIVGANVCPIESLDYEYELNFATVSNFLS